MDVKLKISCCYCKKEFLRYRSMMKGKTLYCSMECRNKGSAGKPHFGRTRPITQLHLVPCSYCQTPVKAWRFQLAKKQNIFCSRKCLGKFNSLYKIAENACNWKGGKYTTIAKVLNNSRYRKVRELALKLDYCKCQLCGSKEKLEAHHIIPVHSMCRCAWVAITE